MILYVCVCRVFHVRIRTALVKSFSPIVLIFRLKLVNYASRSRGSSEMSALKILSDWDVPCQDGTEMCTFYKTITGTIILN